MQFHVLIQDFIFYYAILYFNTKFHAILCFNIELYILLRNLIF